MELGMSHSFDPEIAGRVGLNAAVIYQNVLFWCAHNAANDKHIHNGLAWTYNSLEAFVQLFPYLTKNQIRTAIKKLEGEGLLKRGNFNKAGYDRTTWYAAINPQFSAMCEKSQMDVRESTNGCVGKHAPIPDINTDNNNIKRAIPANWWPEEFGPNTKSAAIVSGWSDDHLAAQVEQFKANHAAKGNKFCDPQAAWSTWVLNSEKFKPRNGNGTGFNKPSGRNAAELARANLGIG